MSPDELVFPVATWAIIPHGSVRFMVFVCLSRVVRNSYDSGASAWDLTDKRTPNSEDFMHVRHVLDRNLKHP